MTIGTSGLLACTITRSVLNNFKRGQAGGYTSSSGWIAGVVWGVVWTLLLAFILDGYPERDFISVFVTTFYRVCCHATDIDVGVDVRANVMFICAFVYGQRRLFVRFFYGPIF